MNFISCLVSVRTNGCGEGVDSFDVSVEQLLLVLLVFLFIVASIFVSLAPVLVVFSQWVNSSHLVAQSFSFARDCNP